MKKIAIVIPCFDDDCSALTLCSELCSEIERDLSIFVIDDDPLPGKDIPSYSSRLNIPRSDSINIYWVTLRRNLGQQGAICAGVATALSHLGAESVQVLTMDGDGEDTAKGAACLLANGQDDCVVVGKRGRRHENLRFKSGYVMYRALFYLLTGKNIDFGNFMSMQGWMASEILANNSASSHFAATTLSMRYKVKRIRLDRGKRTYGRSKMRLSKLIRLGFDAATVFPDQLIARFAVFNVTTWIISIACAILLVLMKIFVASVPVGLPTILILILCATSVICTWLFLSTITSLSYVQSLKKFSTPDYLSEVRLVEKIN